MITLLSLLVMFSLALLTVNIKQEKGLFFFESFVIWVMAPIQTFFTNTVSSISDVFDHYFFIVNASHDNARLKARINALSKENRELVERVKRRDRVARLIQNEDPREGRMVIATVIGRDSTQWSHIVVIDKGVNDGVEENLAVVTNAGIVGHIIQSAGSASKVLLITDSRSAVDSLFQDSRDTGVIVGIGESQVKMKYVPMNADVKFGSSILSSGLGGTFPKGLKIGAVSSIARKEQGLFQDIMVNPGVDFSRLEEVMVLLR